MLHVLFYFQCMLVYIRGNTWQEKRKPRSECAVTNLAVRRQKPSSSSSSPLYPHFIHPLIMTRRRAIISSVSKLPAPFYRQLSFRVMALHESALAPEADTVKLRLGSDSHWTEPSDCTRMYLYSTRLPARMGTVMAQSGSLAR